MKKTEKQQLFDLYNQIKGYGQKGVRFFLITRHLKGNVKHSDKMLNKHDFKLWQINIDENIQSVLFSTISEQLDFMLNRKDYDISTYEVIDDDLEKIYSYSISNRTLAFNDIIENQFKSAINIPKLNNFNEIFKDIWAYCIRIQYARDDYFYSFKKIGRSKVLVDESQQGSKFNKQFKAFFNTTDNRLELIEGDTLSIDKSIDCIFLEDKYYVFHKANFEKILELDDEFKETSDNFIQDLKQTDLFEGLELLEEKTNEDRRLIRKIAKICASNGYKNLDLARLKKMQAIAKQFKVVLKVKNNKILLENDEDVDIMIKMLDDYFLESNQTGNKYGAAVKTKMS